MKLRTLAITIAMLMGIYANAADEVQSESVTKNVTTGHVSISPSGTIRNIPIVGQFTGLVSSDTKVIPSLLHARLGTQKEIDDIASASAHIGVASSPSTGVTEAYAKGKLDIESRRWKIRAGLISKLSRRPEGSSIMSHHFSPWFNVEWNAFNTRRSRLAVEFGTLTDRTHHITLGADANPMTSRPNMGVFAGLRFAHELTNGVNVNAWATSTGAVADFTPATPVIQAGVGVTVSTERLGRLDRVTVGSAQNNARFQQAVMGE